MRSGWVPWALNGAAFLLLALGTQMIARQAAPWDPAAWSAPWSGDVILTLATLLFLGVAIVTPLHTGVLNLGVYAQFLAGFAAAAAIARVPSLDPSARGALAALAGALAGGLVGAVIQALKWRFAVHEVLSGLLLGGALQDASSLAPGLGMPNAAVVGLGLGVLAFGTFLAVSFAQVLRASVPGFELRIVGSSPHAAVAAGVDVEQAQLYMLVLGGGCAGLAGALQIWTPSSAALERWPLPLAFAGLTIAIYGMGTIRGVLAASVLFAAWLSLPGTPVFLGRPGWSALVAALLLLPALWALPRPRPDQGAPRALWRTRHRESR